MSSAAPEAIQTDVPKRLDRLPDVLVIVAVAVFSAFLYAVDSGVGYGIKWVLDHFRQ